MSILCNLLQSNIRIGFINLREMSLHSLIFRYSYISSFHQTVIKAMMCIVVSNALFLHVNYHFNLVDRSLIDALLIQTILTDV